MNEIYDNKQIDYDEVRTAEKGLSAAYEMISELTIKVNELEEEVKKKDAAIQSLVSKIEYLRKVISGMRNSISWKLTKPLRVVSSLKKKMFS